jgi:adenylate cyclase
VKPIIAALVPLVPEQTKANIERAYIPGREAKALAIGPRGGSFFDVNQENTDEAVRRTLESCGNNAGVPCLLVAINENFIVPIPVTMKATGFFQPAVSAIAPELRATVTQRLAAGSGWTAVAAGSSGHAGVAVGAASEQDAINGALADCAKQDSGCRVIAIGPFAVEGR